jgi:hypothetical protein
MKTTMVGKRVNFLEDDEQELKLKQNIQKPEEINLKITESKEPSEIQFIIKNPDQFISKLKKVKQQEIIKDSFFTKRRNRIVTINFKEESKESLEIPFKTLDFLTKIDNKTEITSKVLIIKKKLARKGFEKRYKKRREIINSHRQKLKNKFEEEIKNNPNQIIEENDTKSEKYEFKFEKISKDWFDKLLIVDEIDLNQIYVKESDESNEEIDSEDSNHEDNPNNNYPDTPEESDLSEDEEEKGYSDDEGNLCFCYVYVY